MKVVLEKSDLEKIKEILATNKDVTKIEIVTVYKIGKDAQK